MSFSCQNPPASCESDPFHDRQSVRTVYYSSRDAVWDFNGSAMQSYTTAVAPASDDVAYIMSLELAASRSVHGGNVTSQFSTCWHQSHTDTAISLCRSTSTISRTAVRCKPESVRSRLQPSPSARQNI